jgi:peptidoglycan/xylan/chitin deacetylase (PgdA/CDA1 family)
MLKRFVSSALYHGTRLVAPHVARDVARLPAGGFVSFSFDDFPASAAREGAAIVEGFDARATYYVAMSMAAGACGFSGDDLTRVVEGGHELGCHTYSHLDCLPAADALLLADIERNAKEAGALVGAAPLRHFAYPFGRIHPQQKALLAKRFATQRSIFPGVHRGTVDLRLLRANKLYSAGPFVDRALSAVDRVAQRGGWVVFFTHDVSRRPSAYGVTPYDLAHVVERAARAGLTIAPVGEIAKRCLPA